MISLNKKYLSKSEIIFANHIGIEISDNGYDFLKEKAEFFGIEYGKCYVKVFYRKKSEIFRGMTIACKSNEHQNFRFFPKVDSLGVMCDCSRNAVPKISTLKDFVLDIASMGYDQLQLYTEDTFEVEGEPYFGYLRGRYSIDEIKELDLFSKDYGIELVPAIQTLAHLNSIFRWDCYKKVNDVADILLCDDENTYKLLDKMFASLRKMYSTNNINIGMDEAHLLGLGKYLEKNGFISKMDIFLRHISKVIKLLEKYDFKPMMWSDMFFKIATGRCTYEELDAVNFDENVLSLIPKNISLVYWNYGASKQDYYDLMIKSHLDMKREVIFAGGTQKWVGFCPNLQNAFIASRRALNSVTRFGIKKVLVTAWGDDGAVGSLYLTLPVLALYAEGVYKNNTEDSAIDERLVQNFGRKLSDFILLEQPNRMPGNELDEKCLFSNTNRPLLWNDPVVGIFDKHIPNGTSMWLKKISDNLFTVKNYEDRFSYVFETIYYLTDFLSVKAEIGKKVREAYCENDIAELNNTKLMIPKIIEMLDVFHKVFRKNWNKENKPFGFDVQDIRFGGLRARLIYLYELLEDYTNGKISKIEEFEVALLYNDCRTNENDYPLNKSSNLWAEISTVNVIK